MDRGKKRRDAILGIVLFSFGALVGLLLAGSMVWADLEARLFDPSMSGQGAMGIRCPALMGRDERVTVSAAFRNPLDRQARYVVRTHVSDGHVTLLRRLDTYLDLDPGERQRLEWEVTPQDAAYGLFALVKVHRFSFWPLPAAQGSCGIVLVDLALPGGVILGIVLAAALLSMGGGYLLWFRASRPLTESALHTSRAMVVLATLAVLGLFLGFVNLWLLGLVVLAISALLVVVLLGLRLEKQRQ
jgi:hypothetical protein